ncbi:MAG: 50S ribosomal protein L13 [Candidatus Aminicenantes bacterium]|nr:50S ribosomal protein L13 [Candidatus Aminicenantes bacterium]
MKTFVPKKGDIKPAWWVVDAEGKILGRLATAVATLLRGKNKPTFAPFVDTGDFVVVINAAKVAVTGRKPAQKKYYSHSQYPGGLRTDVLEDVLAKNPEDVIKKAVWGMIPKNKLGRSVYKKLKVYRGPEHPHQAQNPREFRV